MATAPATYKVSLKEVAGKAITVSQDDVVLKLPKAGSQSTGAINASNLITGITPATEGKVPTWSLVGLEDRYWTKANAFAYSMTDSSVAIVDNYGTVTPLKAGSAFLTIASKAEPSVTAQIGVQVVAADEEAEETLVPYAAVKFTAADNRYTVDLSEETFSVRGHFTTAPDNVYGDQLLYSSSNKAVGDFTYPNVGTLNLKSAGETVVTVSSQLSGKALNSCTVTVTEGKPKYYTDLKFNPTELTFYMTGDEDDNYDWLDYYLISTPTEKPANDSLIWESSNTKVADVSTQNGYVYYKSAGEATITVKSKKNEKCPVAKITVKVVGKYFTSITFQGVPTEVNFSTGSLNAKLYLTLQPDDVVLDEDDSLEWYSSKPEIATVNKKGVVTFTKSGAVTILAKSKKNPNVYGSFDLNIVDDSKKDITKLTAIKSEFSVKTNAPVLDLKPFISAEPADYVDAIVFSSADPSIVKVSEDGKVDLKKCLPGGPIEITVRTANGKADPIKVKVTHEKDETVLAIKFHDTPAELKKKVGVLDAGNYLGTDPWYYADYLIGDLVWTTDKPEYATVKAGIVKFQKPGETVTITAASKDGTISASFQIKTTDVPVTAIKFANEKLSLKVGEQFELNKLGVTIEPADADYPEEGRKGIKWISSDPDIVKIEKGKLVPLSVGTVTITAAIENAYDEVYGTFEVEVTEDAVASIKFAKQEYTKKISNEDVVMTVYFAVKPYNATLTKKDFTIQSSDRNVADVQFDSFSEKHGMYSATVTFNGPGTAKITVRSADNEKVYGSTQVTAEAIQVKKIKLPKKSMKLFYYFQGDQQPIMQNWYEISPKIQPSNAWYKVTWETTNPGVAFVKYDLEDKSGIYVVATGAGTATITMTVDDGVNVRQAKMKVIVVSKTVDLKLNKKKATITMIKGKDNTVQLIAYDPVTEDAVPVKWTSSNKKVASVSKDGLVKALKAGEATITATTKDGNETTATCVITVEKKLVTSLKAKGTLKLAKKETKQLSIKIKPSDAYNTKLSFKSSDESVATVDANGLVKGIAKGEAIITVKTTDGSKLSLEIAVTVA